MDDILDQLPEIKFFRKCQKCGSTDWTACNLTSDNRVVVDCNKCPDKPKDWSPLDNDPSLWCHQCGAMHRHQCKCGLIAENN